MTNTKYLEQFKNIVDVPWQHGGDLRTDKEMVEKEETFQDLKDNGKQDVEI